MISRESHSIQIRRLIPAERHEVFEAWTDPLLLASWFAPGDLSATVHCLEVEEGGTFGISMSDDSREQIHVVGGKFLEVVVPQRLRMTWSWEGDPDPPSLVTVDFLARQAGTEVVVTHDQLSQEAAALHTEGWSSCLEQLLETMSAS